METRKSPHPHLGEQMDYNEKTEVLAELNEDAVIYHNIEDALIGYLERFGQPTIAVYDYDKAIECLMVDDSEQAYEDAVEWMQYNTLGTWAGEGTPAFLHRFKEDEWEENNNTSMKPYGWWTKTVTKITETLRLCGQWWGRVGR